RPYARHRRRILAVILPDFLLAAGNLSSALHDRARELVVAHLDVVLLADFRKHEAEPHAALGDGVIFLPRLLLGRALVGEGATLLLEVGFDDAPDVPELVLHQRRRR